MALKTLTVLAFAMIFVPNQAAAQCGEGGCNYIYQTGQGSYSNNNPSYSNSYYNSTPYQAPIYTPTPAPTPVVYSNTTNPNPVMTVNYTPKKVATTTKPKTVAKAPTNANALTANAVYGSNGFLPSGLIQWILFAIFVLLIVILSRRVFGAKDKYQTAPLKHD